MKNIFKVGAFTLSILACCSFISTNNAFAEASVKNFPKVIEQKYEQNDYIQAWEEIADKNDKDWEAFASLAILYYDKGDFSSSYTAIKRANRLYDKYEYSVSDDLVREAMVKGAVSAYKLGKQNKAEGILKKMLDLNLAGTKENMETYNGMAYYYLAAISKENGYYNQAYIYIDSALYFCPDDYIFLDFRNGFFYFRGGWHWRHSHHHYVHYIPRFHYRPIPHRDIAHGPYAPMGRPHNRPVQRPDFRASHTPIHKPISTPSHSPIYKPVPGQYHYNMHKAIAKQAPLKNSKPTAKTIPRPSIQKASAQGNSSANIHRPIPSPSVQKAPAHSNSSSNIHRPIPRPNVQKASAQGNSSADIHRPIPIPSVQKAPAHSNSSSNIYRPIHRPNVQKASTQSNSSSNIHRPIPRPNVQKASTQGNSSSNIHRPIPRPSVQKASAQGNSSSNIHRPIPRTNPGSNHQAVARQQAAVNMQKSQVPTQKQNSGWQRPQPPLQQTKGGGQKYQRAQQNTNGGKHRGSSQEGRRH